MKRIRAKKALACLLALVMVLTLAIPTVIASFASGESINVTSAEALKAALSKDTPVAAINITADFEVNDECFLLFDAAHLGNYHDTVMTIAEGVTLTIGNGGGIGSMWPSYEGDWQTPPLPNGKIINNGTVVVENGGAIEADFDTNNGDVLVKDGGCAVCCNTNNGTVVVEDGGQYATTQGTIAANKGNVVIHQGAIMVSRFGTKIVNEENATLELNGQFQCGCIGDGMWFENKGSVSGNGEIILYEAAHDMLPVNDMDVLIEALMAQLGQSKRFENWDDVNIYKLLEVSDYAALKAALTGQRRVAGEEVPGDMDTLIRITADISIAAGEEIGTMARLTVPEEVTLTVSEGATLGCGIDNYGVINVLPGGNLLTTQGGSIENFGTISVSEGAVIKSRMGGEIFNQGGASLTINGTCYCGCIGYGENDGCWFANFGTLSGNGEIVLYEAAHDVMPVNDMQSLCNRIAAQIAGADSVPTIRSQDPHEYTEKVVAPKAAALGYTVYTCTCGKTYTGAYTAPTGKIGGFKCKARTAAAETLQWSGVKTASGYQIQVSTKDGKKWDKTYNLKAGVTSYTFKNLAAGNAYKFRIRFFIKAADGNNYYAPWVSITSPTLPAGTSLSKVTGASKAFTAQWKKQANATGYQVQYSVKSNFSGAKSVTVKSVKTLKTTVKKLSAKKVYYVRIRTYKAMSGANYYSAWSKAVKVKTK